MNRNHFLMVGLVVLMLGIQFHVVEQYVLNERATKFTAEKFGKEPGPVAQNATLFFPSGGPPSLAKKTIETPEWLGWLMMSVGTVLVLHSFAMPKPT